MLYELFIKLYSKGLGGVFRRVFGRKAYLTKIKASFTDWTGAEKESSQGDLHYLERNIAIQIRKGSVRVIQKIQGYNSDIINFGEELRVQDQALYSES